jgi:hypothetical protein
VWYVVWNLRCTVTIDSVLANSKTQNLHNKPQAEVLPGHKLMGPKKKKTQNTFLFPVHAMFHQDFPLAVKPASTPRRLGHKKIRKILYLLICSPSAWPSRLLYRRGRKSWRYLWITLYVKKIQVCLDWNLKRIAGTFYMKTYVLYICDNILLNSSYNEKCFRPTLYRKHTFCVQ